MKNSLWSMALFCQDISWKLDEMETAKGQVTAENHTKRNTTKQTQLQKLRLIETRNFYLPERRLA